MKKMMVTGILGVMLLFTACSAKIKGGYTGKLEVDGGKSWSEKDEKAFVLVKGVARIARSISAIRVCS